MPITEPLRFAVKGVPKPTNGRTALRCFVWADSMTAERLKEGGVAKAASHYGVPESEVEFEFNRKLGRA